MVIWISKHQHHKFISIYLFHNFNYCNNSNFDLQSIEFLSRTECQFWHKNLICYSHMNRMKNILAIKHKTITIKSALTLAYISWASIFLLFRPPPELYHNLGLLRSIWKALEFKNRGGKNPPPPRNVGLIVKYFIATNLL